MHLAWGIIVHQDMPITKIDILVLVAGPIYGLDDIDILDILLTLVSQEGKFV